MYVTTTMLRAGLIHGNWERIWLWDQVITQFIQRQVLSRDNSSDGGEKALELFCAECLDEKLRKRGEENAESAMIEKEEKKSATAEGVMAAKLPGQLGNCTAPAPATRRPPPSVWSQSVVSVKSQKGFIDKTWLSRDGRTRSTSPYTSISTVIL